jgi:ribonuclease-3
VNLRFYFALVRMLGFIPGRLFLYRQAFLPKSVVHIHFKNGQDHNERLEYLGDAVLDSIVADYLYRKFPRGNEGFMSQVRARIVKRKNLDYLAVQLGIPAFIPAKVTSHSSKHLFGNTLEALIGAIYMDRGYRIARRFFLRRILKRHVDLARIVRKDPDYKSRILEWAQKKRIEIQFTTTEEQPSEAKPPSFIATIYLNHENRGTGRGSSKKEAEQQAARQALTSIEP